MLPSILAAYPPMDRRQALASGTALPEHSQGAVLFADLSGFCGAHRVPHPQPGGGEERSPTVEQ